MNITTKHTKSTKEKHIHLKINFVLFVCFVVKIYSLIELPKLVFGITENT
jgi:hypothetical protein